MIGNIHSGGTWGMAFKISQTLIQTLILKPTRYVTLGMLLTSPAPVPSLQKHGSPPCSPWVGWGGVGSRGCGVGALGGGLAGASLGKFLPG